MNKYIITFGSGQLTEFFVRPTTVMLVIEAENEEIARQQAFDFPGIGDKFCTSYVYDAEAVELITMYGMKEYSLQDLEERRLNKNMDIRL